MLRKFQNYFSILTIQRGEFANAYDEENEPHSKWRKWPRNRNTNTWRFAIVCKNKNRCLETLVADTGWRHCLQTLFGDTGWRHRLETLAGDTVWRHWLETPVGDTGWRHWLRTQYDSFCTKHLDIDYAVHSALYPTDESFSLKGYSGRNGKLTNDLHLELRLRMRSPLPIPSTPIDFHDEVFTKG
jgi:hypothetical protein